MATAIKDMVIRGAPAIGVAAAMGLALGVKRSRPRRARPCAAEFEAMAATLAATRPTAVNLFWAIERMKRRFAADERLAGTARALARRLWSRRRRAIEREDLAACEAMGEHGAALLPA